MGFPQDRGNPESELQLLWYFAFFLGAAGRGMRGNPVGTNPVSIV